MTNEELIARLRELGDHASFEPHMHHTAADRIEALIAERDASPSWQEWKEILAAGYEQKSRAEAAEAKLAKAVETLEYYNVAGHEGKEARAALAEIKLQSSEFATQKGETHE